MHLPEDVESPVALAIPIPDEGIYLALAVPGEADWALGVICQPQTTKPDPVWSQAVLGRGT